MIVACNAPDNKWFSFAITYIHMCFMVFEWFESNATKVIELGYSNRMMNLDLYNCLASVLFVRFHCLWGEIAPENVMAFREIMIKFRSVVEKELVQNTLTLTHHLLARG